MKKPYLGAHGHIAISTLSIPRAASFLKRKGIGTRPDTMKLKDGKAVAVYLDREISGFAIHLLQR
jgi:2-dehydro-3-deoxyphosphogluconate aldolase/(4S)-4-hydroxy-2-oxoglutarate aldolase